MRNFSYSRPGTFDEACRVAEHTRFLAGGTNLIDLMKSDVERPAHVVDLKSLSMDQIEELPDGGLRLGALATNAGTAEHPLVTGHFPCWLPPFSRGPVPRSGMWRPMAAI